jgi:hypothetical protein
MRWIKCPDAGAMRQAQAAVRRAASYLASIHGAFVFHWVLARVKFCSGSIPRFLDRRNAAEQSKRITVSSVWHQGCLEIEHHRRGEGVRRLPGNWSIQDREALHKSHKNLQQDMHAWLRDHHVPRRIGRHCWRQSKIPQFPEQEQPAAESDYIFGMTQHQNEVLLQDDKDKKATWTMSFACLSAIFMSLVLLDPQWEVTTMSPASLSVLVHGVSLFAIPAFMRKGPRHKGSYAPYMYPFVKAKCFSATGGHTCSKANHSCLRKVVSFFKSPWRRAWRLAGRAIQVLISLTGDGFSVWQLKQIIPTFRARMAKLRVSQQPGQCIMCGKCKPFTSLLIADAAQMYEQINTILVLEAIDAKAATLRSEKGADAITVAKARLVKGWPGGSEHARSRACITFPLWRLRRMLQASCFLRFASVGDLVVAAKGLMIGGLLSMIAAVCLLSHEEEQFLQHANDRIINFPEGWKVEELFFGMRYVDDLLMVSYAICHKCLQQMLAEIYSVQFSVNAEECEQTFTDVIFQVDPICGAITWTAKNPNKPWLLGTGDKGKQRRVPYLDRLQCPFGLLRGLLLSRAARLNELELTEKLQTACMIEEIQELILEGYPISLLRALVHSLPFQSIVFLNLR